MSIHTQSPRRSRSKTSTRSPSTLSPKQKPSKQHKTNTHQSPGKSTTAKTIKASRSRPPAPPLTTLEHCTPPPVQLKTRKNHKQPKQQQKQLQKQNLKQNQKQNQKQQQRKSVAFNNIVTVRPHHSERPTNQMSVSFHEVVMVRPILHLDDYTDQELSDCWVGKADKLKTKVDILKTIKLLKAGNTDGCAASRGLEKFSDGGKARERRRISIRDVLDEQESQRRSSACSNSSIVYDVSKFRKAYKPHSRAARHVAHAVGKIDEMEAACQKVTSMPSHKMAWTRR